MKTTRAEAAAVLVAGLVFGSGLIVAGMTQPAKVQGFLDFGGNWDPSLALVMVAAIAVAAPAFQLAARRGRSVLGAPMPLPPHRPVTLRLVTGSALFGIGWGLSGYCPGPALVSLASGSRDVLTFVAAMACGMLVFDRLVPAAGPAKTAAAAALTPPPQVGA